MGILLAAATAILCPIKSKWGDKMMETIQPILEQAIAIAREGFTQVDAGLGLLIAIAATFMVRRISDLVAMSLASTVAHVIVKRLSPIITGDGTFIMPPLLEAYFWRGVGTLFVGYLVLITALYIVRKLVLRR